MKIMAFLTMCVSVVSFAFPVAAVACLPPPECGLCEYWDGDSCELIGGCDDEGDCPGCQNCIECFCDYDNSLCEPGKWCCADTLCKECCGAGYCAPYECCTNGVCVDPICDNCHTISKTLFECGHFVEDPNGTACASNWCIRNYLDTATCDYKGPDWPCPGVNCDTKAVSPNDAEVIQVVVQGQCFRNPPGNVNYQAWVRLHFGCISCAHDIYTSACETYGCLGPTLWTAGRGEKKVCGCD